MERCLGDQRCRKVRRCVKNGKLSAACLLLTFVVLRGTIGAGKFGTPEQDFTEIRRRFYSTMRSDPHRALDEVPTADWDSQRSNWLHQRHNSVRPDKPLVLLVTGSSPKPCENPTGDHYVLKSIKNKIDYCRHHRIEIFYNMALLDATLIRKLLLSRPEIEFLWWMDSDAMFTDMAYEVPWERYKDHNLVILGWNDTAYDESSWVGLNTGSFLLRNSQWALDLLDAMEPKGEIRDDQSAMVHTLATQRSKWGTKVYLESQYYLGDDRFEEMIEKPLLTHFVGCKPCAKLGDYPAERCMNQMDRAFSFGDSQILEMYGLAPKSLTSSRVKDKTTNLLLHHAFKVSS